MSEFLDAALAFPAVLFSFALVVVVVYWLIVLVGGAEIDALDGGEGVGSGTSAGAGGGAVGFFAVFGLGGVPVTIVLSLLTAIAWFVSLAGAALLEHPALRALLLPVALLAAWSATWTLVRPLRRLAPAERGISRRDFVGRVCVIRTGRVDSGFGQAEVTADDGSSAIVQVRTDETGESDKADETGDTGAAGGLTSGSTALIFDYDAEGEFFRVAPFDSALDPGQPSG